jgi:GxxExxY protein
MSGLRLDKSGPSGETRGTHASYISAAEAGYLLDLLVESLVVVELKAVERILPIHQAQLLSYLELSGLRLGFLLNFNVLHMREGIKRIAN